MLRKVKSFDPLLFKSLMEVGGSGSEFLCKLLLSWRDYPATKARKMEDFTIAGIYHTLDSQSREQVILMLTMSMHDPVFAQLEATARKLLEIK